MRDNHFDEELYRKLKAKSSELTPLLPMDVGCGVFESYYGSRNGRDADVDQLWVDKATGQILREEGFCGGESLFTITYSRYEKTSDRRKCLA